MLGAADMPIGCALTFFMFVIVSEAKQSTPLAADWIASSLRSLQ